MENYSFNLTDLVISRGCILRKTDASKIYNSVIIFLSLFFLAFLFVAIKRWYHGSDAFYIYLILLVINLTSISASWVSKQHTLKTHFVVDGIKSVKFKKKGLGSFLRRISNDFPVAIVETENGSRTPYKIFMHGSTLNEFIFELVNKNIRIEEIQE